MVQLIGVVVCEDTNEGYGITNTYDAAGTVLKVTNSTGEYWDYDGALIYKNGALYQMATPEGRATYTGTTWSYEYDYQDHLGNTRLSFKANGQALEKTASTDYDPLGLVLNGTSKLNAIPNRWELQGKERESVFGLNRISFGARTYNPTIGRFDGVDAMAEMYEDQTPFHYNLNNPLSFVDHDGMSSDSTAGKVPGCNCENNQSNQSNKSEGNNMANVSVSSNNSSNFYMPPTGFNTYTPGSHKLSNFWNTRTNNAGFRGVVSAALGTDFETYQPTYGDIIFSFFIQMGKGYSYNADLMSRAGGYNYNKINNPVPKTLARVIPADLNSKTLGPPNKSDVFVTAFADIRGLNSNQIAQRLTIAINPSGFKIITFSLPKTGLASPIFRFEEKGFIGFGKTAGGAREFVLPNQIIPINSKIKIVK